ncbi:mariner Mos1 transposase [Trichonephila clavipes]|nr:mariner Mos1 transposase [Trichonephila clavipes]
MFVLVKDGLANFVLDPSFQESDRSGRPSKIDNDVLRSMLILREKNLTVNIIRNSSKTKFHQQKVLLCLWWDRKGPVYYELLKQGKTINTDLYCNQLDKLNTAIKEKKASISIQKRISVPP